MNPSLARFRSAMLAVLMIFIGAQGFAQNSLTISNGQSA